MCQIALSKSTKKVKKNNYSSDCSDSSESSEKNHAASPQKNHAPFFFIYFLRNFGKGSLTHLTADVMFSGQRSAILAMFVVYCTHLRFKNAQPKMCHSPKVEAKVNKKKFFFISWTLLSDNFY